MSHTRVPGWWRIARVYLLIAACGLALELGVGMGYSSLGRDVMMGIRYVMSVVVVINSLGVILGALLWAVR